MSKKTFVVFAAHPDDAERHMGGTIVHLARNAHRGVLVALTSGQMGTFGDPEVRSREFRKAADMLGVEAIVLDFVDTQIQDDAESRLKIARCIRQQKPDLIFAPYPRRGGCIHGIHAHPDHYVTGEVVTKAIALASIRKIDDSEPHRVAQLFHYLLPDGVEPNVLFPITDEEMALALRAIDAHESQKPAYKGNVPLVEYLKTNEARYLLLKLPGFC